MPQSKLHLKLLHATKVIIALVKEKKHLTVQLKEATASLDRRKTPSINKQSGSNGTAVHVVRQCDKCIQTVKDSPRGHVQWTSQKLSESSTEQKSRVGLSDTETTPSMNSKPKVIPLSLESGHKSMQDQVLRHKQTSPNNQDFVHEEVHSSSQVLPQDEQLDVSLASLKFTDSSLGESSLHQVLQMVERELSSSDNDRDAPMRHSTPEPALERGHQPLQECHKDNDRSLKLVGSKVVPHVQSKKLHGRPQIVALTNRSRTQNRASVKPRVRNYNIRD